MLQIRNFLPAAAGTLGLLELFESEDLLMNETDLAALAIKALITLTVGLLSSFLTRLFRKDKSMKNKPSKSTHIKKAIRSLIMQLTKKS